MPFITTKLKIKTLLLGLTIFTFSGCLGNRHCPPLNTVPACKVRNATCCDNTDPEKINFLMLRRTPPDTYILGGGDTLGIYIQGITGDKDTPPPVHFPEDPGLQPALGYPVPIRDDGYISLPLIEPIQLEGLTLAQAEARIRDAYTKDREILIKGSDKIIVTLIQRRKYNVLVIREDATDNREISFRSNEVFVDDQRQGQTFSIELPAYENDVLHALSETGGMPGEGAVNEIVIIRDGLNLGIVDPDAIISTTGDKFFSTTLRDANVTRIPIEAIDGSLPELSEEEITLNDGDVIFIEGRKREVFYTGGLIEGGRFPLPRDYEIDVLEAIALAGGSSRISQSAGSRGSGVLPPTRVLILREKDCQFCTIEVDLRCIKSDPSQRVIIEPGDIIQLEFRPKEQFINTVVSIFQFGSVFRLFD
ncbi:MAG: polysaccharide biosynthesis/export family protein [Planctomycetota bacterium]